VASGELSGFVARVQPSAGIHDRLLARALLVDDGTERLLWLHADLIGFERSFVDDLKAELRRRHGLQPRQVIVSATHTHSGPPTVPLVNCGQYDAAYVRRLKTDLLSAAAGALGSAGPAELVWAEGRCELAVDRRGKASVHADPRVGVLGWRRPDGSFVAVLANYAMHNVALGPENRLISADVAGQAARHVEEHLAGGPTVLLTNGACGNLNPPSVGNDFAQMQAWGDQLGGAVVAALGQAASAVDATVRAELCTLGLPIVRLDESSVRALAARQRERLIGHGDYVSARCRAAIDEWERHMERRIRGGPIAAGEPMDLQALRIGPAVLVAVGAEPFSRLTDELRALSGRTVYVVGYANGLVGYLAPVQTYDEGGYEVDGAFVFYGGPPVAAGAYEFLREWAARLVGRVSS